MRQINGRILFLILQVHEFIEIWGSKKLQSSQLLHLLDKETIFLWRTDKAKKLWFRHQLGKEINRVCLHSLLGPWFHILDDKGVPLRPGIRRVTFIPEIYFLLSGRQKGASECPSFTTVSQITLIQNIEYTKVVYFGMTCLLLHLSFFFLAPFFFSPSLLPPSSCFYSSFVFMFFVGADHKNWYYIAN